MEKFEAEILKAQSDRREAVINSFTKEEVKVEDKSIQQEQNQEQSKD